METSGLVDRFYFLLKRNTESLGVFGQEERRVLYKRARKALLLQFEGMNQSVSDDDEKKTHLLSFEEAIARLEAEIQDAVSPAEGLSDVSSEGNGFFVPLDQGARAGESVGTASPLPSPSFSSPVRSDNNRKSGVSLGAAVSSRDAMPSSGSRSALQSAFQRKEATAAAMLKNSGPVHNMHRNVPSPSSPSAARNWISTVRKGIASAQVRSIPVETNDSAFSGKPLVEILKERTASVFRKKEITEQDQSDLVCLSPSAATAMVTATDSPSSSSGKSSVSSEELTDTGNDSKTGASGFFLARWFWVTGRVNKKILLLSVPFSFVIFGVAYFFISANKVSVKGIGKQMGAFSWFLNSSVSPDSVSEVSSSSPASFVPPSLLLDSSFSSVKRPLKSQERVLQLGNGFQQAFFSIETPPLKNLPVLDRFSGISKWTVEGEGQDAVLSFFVDISGHDTVFEMRMKRNSDSSISASHFIEIFQHSSSKIEFSRLMESIGIITMSNAFDVPDGAALRYGAFALTKKDRFTISLLNNQEDLSYNLEQLKKDGWMMIPIIFKGEDRGMLSVKKDREVIDLALKQWEQDS
ncbi:MAG: hypothetical protein PSN37_03690 [Alphaproteobacteria bacterium]|nr:hypothetical protein [Alphaproteobacteria bacterium]